MWYSFHRQRNQYIFVFFLNCMCFSGLFFVLIFSGQTIIHTSIKSSFPPPKHQHQHNFHHYLKHHYHHLAQHYHHHRVITNIYFMLFNKITWILAIMFHIFHTIQKNSMNSCDYVPYIPCRSGKLHEFLQQCSILSLYHVIN